MRTSFKIGDVVRFKCDAVKGKFLITKIKGLYVYLKTLSTGALIGRHDACDLEIVQE